MKNVLIVSITLVLSLFACKKDPVPKEASSKVNSAAKAVVNSHFINKGLKLIKEQRLDLASFVTIPGDLTAAMSSRYSDMRLSNITDHTVPLSALRIYLGAYRGNQYVKADKFIEISLKDGAVDELKRRDLLKGFGSVIAFYVMTMKAPFSNNDEIRSFNGLGSIDQIEISPVRLCGAHNPSATSFGLEITKINHKDISAMAHNVVETRSIEDLQLCLNNMSTLYYQMSEYVSSFDNSTRGSFLNVQPDESIGPKFYFKSGKVVPIYNTEAASDILKKLQKGHRDRLYISVQSN